MSLRSTARAFSRVIWAGIQPCLGADSWRIYPRIFDFLDLLGMVVSSYPLSKGEEGWEVEGMFVCFYRVNSADKKHGVI